MLGSRKRMVNMCRGKREAGNINRIWVYCLLFCHCVQITQEKFRKEKFPLDHCFRGIQSNIMAGKAEHSS